MFQCIIYVLSLFENVSCIIYVLSLSGYCTSIYENDSCITLLDSIQLFYEICNYERCFTDLFKQQLKITPLTFCFGKEYKERNFNQRFMSKEDIKIMVKISNRLISKLFNHDDDDDMIIPVEVVMIV